MKTSMRGPDMWFGYVQGELELLRAYVINVENQLEKGLIQFVKSFDEEVIEYENTDGTREHVHHRLIYDGLDDSTWEITDIFNSYFPSLHRRSCFITIYSFSEHSLENLCGRYARTSALKITTKDLKGTGIDRSKLYLGKAVGLNLSNAAESWKKVKELQKIRNLVVHSNGRIKENEAMNVIKRVNHVHLQGNEIVLEEGFLGYALNSFEEFFRIVHENIRAQNSKPNH